ncbi:hypothetical protein [Algibacter pectinivorans]|uniref:DUF4252 domain-containing protein n=1 Tax=Algibacter pectinivorans TaxID=870482 RepID=A0A1I1SB60_9FLAO|nr:hypothetical protein [Algibacter pectinivorans]SFD43721.1 hypothetical protein SAMN04487987_1202 [Algibacter pectinivorans]SFD43806.1 hypothetical protein SAMN04487987_1212 [Algibacter pectinivorans]
MKLKQKLFTILFLTISTIGIAQDYKNELKKEFNDYLSTIVNMEFEKSMEYIVPEFFEIIPKSQMIKVMKQAFNNPGVEIEITNPKIIGIKDKEEIESKYYSLLTYSNQMNMKIDGESEETKDEKTTRINLTKLSLESTFGSENVEYNEKTEFFKIYSEKKVYGISKNGKSNWKFLVLEKGSKIILDKLLPKELAEKI